ncbi:MAG TPA: M43 family zinc metalloprotease [Bacteroidia bacterium]
MKKIIQLIVLTIVTHNLSAQCLTDHYHNEAKKSNPAIIQEEDNFFNGVTPVSNNKRATKYIIPVVFHVIHTNGPENISQAQIEDQIRILNLDFSFKNANRTAIRSQFTGVTADCEIEFRLAKIDPQGNCTNGINRVYSPLHVDARDNVKSISGARWDNRKYLNIWTVSSIKNQGSTVGTTLGYAYLPFSVAQGAGAMDGIVVRADYVGTIGTAIISGAGRTLTHEVGHYLGLLHTFEDECAGTGSNAGDRCDDTPPVADVFTNANCPSNGNSCTSDVPDLIDQWENFMDYSQGTCQAMFTQDQKSIMHYTLTNYSFRISLVSNNNLIATGVVDGNTAPVAYFSSNTRVACVGDAVSFYDISCKAQVTSRQWTFAGASISSTNKDTPVVTYSAPGKYKVTLTVNNSNGNNTLSVDNYIEIKPNVAIDKPSIIQDFEVSTWNIATGWSVNDQGTSKFTKDSSAKAFRGKAYLYAPISLSVVKGQKYQLVTPSVDLRPLKGKSPKLSMMVAYIRQNASSSEDLRIYYSRGCQQNWTQFFFRNAQTISYSSGSFAASFAPSSISNWKQISAALTQFENDSNISFMIEVTGNQGNPVFIDAINIGQFNTGIEDVENNMELNVYPNPTEGKLNVSYINTVGSTEVWLENIEGKRIATLLEETNNTGTITINWNAEEALPAGMYILKIKSNAQIINKKVIFAN